MREAREIQAIALESELLEFEKEVTPEHLNALQWAINAGRYGVSLSPYLIQEIHSRMFPHGGAWRTHDVFLSGASCIPPRHYSVSYMVKNWCDDLEYQLDKIEEIGDNYTQLQAENHLRFELIHPFSDGNGRVGRVLIQYLAARCKRPLIKLLFTDRSDYIEFLNNKDIQSLSKLFKHREIG